MEFTGQAIPLSAQTLNFIAESLDVQLPAIWSVLTVETSGCGFLRDRRPQILFERHKFHGATGGRFDEVAPDLSNRVRGGYAQTGSGEYERLQRAVALDENAALESTSWGLGQIMGFNAATVGFTDVNDMIEKFRDSEDQQLGAMMAFIQDANIAPALRAEDWPAFAFRYNGAGFKEGHYDEKLADAHARYKVGPLPDLTVRWAQMALTFLAIPKVGGVDGVFGSKTQAALKTFQSSRGLSPTGDPDSATLEELAAALGWSAPG
jgi:peptidoglycan hydrolase-like protein with peptidoglycan-binding domain